MMTTIMHTQAHIHTDRNLDGYENLERSIQQRFEASIKNGNPLFTTTNLAWVVVVEISVQPEYPPKKHSEH